MAVILDTKPRIRLPPIDSLEVRPRRTRNWLPCYALLWVGAAVVGHGIMFGWLPAPRGSRSPAHVAVSSSAHSTVELAPPAVVQSVQGLPTAAVESTEHHSKHAVDWSNLPSCDSVFEESSEGEARRSLPVDLARSAVGALLDFNRWTVPCRTQYLSRVHLCLAIREGVVIGATARAEPRDESIERCIIRAATLVPVQSESVVRKVQLEIPLGRSR